MFVSSLLLVTGIVAVVCIVVATRPLRRSNPFYC